MRSSLARSPLPIAIAFAIAIAIANGCGARTGLSEREPELEPAPRDAAIDAFVFDTLTCRWSVGQSLELARSEHPFAPSAAVHLVRDEIYVHPGAGHDQVFVVSLSDPPRLLHRGAVDPRASSDLVQVSAHRDGWVELPTIGGDRCVATWRDVELGVIDRTDWGAHCIASPGPPGRLGLVFPGATGSVLATVELRRDAEVETIGSIVAPAGSVVRLAFGLDDTVHVLTSEPPDRSVDVLALGERAALGAREIVPGPVDLLLAATDRLRGGAVVLSRGSDRIALVVTQLAESEIVLTPIATIERARAENLARMTTNETEALFALDDGTMQIVPLNGARPRVLAAPPEGAERMHVALRDGTSAAAQAYSPRLDDGRHALRVRALVCNR
jgi:hypothetical protein